MGRRVWFGLAFLAFQQRHDGHGVTVAKAEICLQPIGDLGGFHACGNAIGSGKALFSRHAHQDVEPGIER